MRPLLGLLLLFCSCEEDDPMVTSDAPPAADARPDSSDPDASCPATMNLPDGGGEGTCVPMATDYSPGAADTWPPCISDDDAYHPFNPTISTIARVTAFEEIATLLFTGSPLPAQAFTEARVIYLEDNGLESRVARREDEHYSPAPMPCANLTVDDQAMYPDRCVGPVKIQPLLNQAFADGAQGLEPELNAARIEAGLLWFLYVSVHKEATTCTSTVADCDSHYAYYTGGDPRTGGKGLSRYVRAQSQPTHDRVWDGILAVRCWRDLDNPTGMAMDTLLRDRAISQLDRALLRGVALLVRERASGADAACGTDRASAWQVIRILGGVLDHEATERDPSQAAALRAALGEQDPDQADLSAVVAALDALFPCP